jgi:BirA family biotin operon repressor/biotin-[acetyl-CoA-carboxylase] ligase
LATRDVTGPGPTLNVPQVSGPPVVVLDEIDSTNAEARRRAEAGEAGPVWITARRQTAGRGRRGRAWDTDEGNLAATLLVTTTRPPIDAAKVSFLAAVAVAQVADWWVPEALVQIKWPNDVMVDGRKLSGILIESGKQPDGRLWLAIGIGINISSSPSNVERPATHLGAHLRSDWKAVPTPLDVLNALSLHLSKYVEHWETDLDNSFMNNDIFTWWHARGYGLNARCVVRLDNETLEGVYEGLDNDGAMVLGLDSGSKRLIHAADVFFGGAC